MVAPENKLQTSGVFSTLVLSQHMLRATPAACRNTPARQSCCEQPRVPRAHMFQLSLGQPDYGRPSCGLGHCAEQRKPRGGPNWCTPLTGHISRTGSGEQEVQVSVAPRPRLTLGNEDQHRFRQWRGPEAAVQQHWFCPSSRSQITKFWWKEIVHFSVKP